MPGESRPAAQQAVAVEEPPFAALTVSISPTELNVAPGEEASCAVVVRNTGTIVDQASLQVEGDAARWAVVEPSTLNIYPGESGTSTLRFFPPRSPHTPSGPARFALRAVSHEDPTVSPTARGVLNVAPYYDVSAELIPFTSQGRRRAEHRFTVSNQGNTRMRTAVNATDPDNQLRFNATPSTLAPDPGTDASATLQVRPRRPLWLGNPLLRPFEVTGTSEGAAQAVRSPGQFQQIAWIPRWVVRVAMLIIPLLIALFIYLFLTANVPAVAGQPSDQATALLTKSGFKPLAAQSQPNDTIHIGDVISTSPSGGRHRKNSPVGVVLSSGIPLPSLAGQDEAAAKSALESKGLIVDEQQVTNAAQAGKVVSTTPPNGSVSKGDHVGLLISTGIPSLMPSPNSVTMPGQAVNSTTAPLAVSVANGGTGPLTVSSVALGGPNAADFAVANNSCTGASVAPGSSCAVQLTFTPTAAGARNAVLTLASNAPQSPPVTISGTGLVSDVGVGATALNFGDQKVGTQSQAQTVAVSNKGGAPMKMGAASVIGTNAKDFSLTDGCQNNTVAPGAGCSIGVVFAPTGAGARSGKLLVVNDSGLSQNVTLSGNGTTPTVVTMPDPVTGLTFKAANTSQDVTIINQGTAPLVLGQIAVQGVKAEVGRNDFKAVPACGGQLAPNGGSCKVTVTFSPVGLTGSLTCLQAALVISDELGNQAIPMFWKSADPVLCGLTDVLSSLGSTSP
jgi:beta-lactam-binding protein with PASTA domain